MTSDEHGNPQVESTRPEPVPAQNPHLHNRYGLSSASGMNIYIPAGIRVLRGDQHANATLQTSETRQNCVVTTRAQQGMTTLYSIFELVWRD